MTSRTSLPARGDFLKGEPRAAELRRLEDKYRHEDMASEDRDRLRCRILKMKAGPR